MFYKCVFLRLFMRKGGLLGSLILIVVVLAIFGIVYSVYGNSLFGFMTGNVVANGGVVNIAEECFVLQSEDSDGKIIGPIYVVAYTGSSEYVELNKLLPVGAIKTGDVISGYRSDVAGEEKAPRGWTVRKCDGGETIGYSTYLSSSSVNVKTQTPTYTQTLTQTPTYTQTPTQTFSPTYSIFKSSSGEENCRDGIDNDKDGKIDCADDDCNNKICDAEAGVCCLRSSNDKYYYITDKYSCTNAIFSSVSDRKKCENDANFAVCCRESRSDNLLARGFSEMITYSITMKNLCVDTPTHYKRIVVDNSFCSRETNYGSVVFKKPTDSDFKQCGVCVNKTQKEGVYDGICVPSAPPVVNEIVCCNDFRGYVFRYKEDCLKGDLDKNPMGNVVDDYLCANNKYPVDNNNGYIFPSVKLSVALPNSNFEANSKNIFYQGYNEGLVFLNPPEDKHTPPKGWRNETPLSYLKCNYTIYNQTNTLLDNSQQEANLVNPLSTSFVCNNLFKFPKQYDLKTELPVYLKGNVYVSDDGRVTEDGICLSDPLSKSKDLNIQRDLMVCPAEVNFSINVTKDVDLAAFTSKIKNVDLFPRESNTIVKVSLTTSPKYYSKSIDDNYAVLSASVGGDFYKLEALKYHSPIFAARNASNNESREIFNVFRNTPLEGEFELARKGVCGEDNFAPFIAFQIKGDEDKIKLDKKLIEGMIDLPVFGNVKSTVAVDYKKWGNIFQKTWVDIFYTYDSKELRQTVKNTIVRIKRGGEDYLLTVDGLLREGKYKAITDKGKEIEFRISESGPATPVCPLELEAYGIPLRDEDFERLITYSNIKTGGINILSPGLGLPNSGVWLEDVFNLTIYLSGRLSAQEIVYIKDPYNSKNKKELWKSKEYISDVEEIPRIKGELEVKGLTAKVTVLDIISMITSSDGRPVSSTAIREKFIDELAKEMDRRGTKEEGVSHPDEKAYKIYDEWFDLQDINVAKGTIPSKYDAMFYKKSINSTLLKTEVFKKYLSLSNCHFGGGPIKINFKTDGNTRIEVNMDQLGNIFPNGIGWNVGGHDIKIGL